jgi:Fe-S-cluster-containing dehydrogenase component
MKYTRRDLLGKTAAGCLTLTGIYSLLDLVTVDSIAETAPVSAPLPVRYGMSVDMRKCSLHESCVACLDACHRFHNVPTIKDPRHAVCWIRKSDFKTIFMDQASGYENAHMLSLRSVIMCNHCGDAPCVRVCPTGATWRRTDGIVMMDPHRCIGCRYCMAACPYGSRSFNFSNPKEYIAADKINMAYPLRTRGVVEKCDLCALRIDRKLKPLCVEACPGKAISFGDLNDPGSEVRKSLRERMSLRRNPELGTDPGIYFIL